MILIVSENNFKKRLKEHRTKINKTDLDVEDK